MERMILAHDISTKKFGKFNRDSVYETAVCTMYLFHDEMSSDVY